MRDYTQATDVVKQNFAAFANSSSPPTVGGDDAYSYPG